MVDFSGSNESSLDTTAIGVVTTSSEGKNRRRKR